MHLIIKQSALASNRKPLAEGYEIMEKCEFCGALVPVEASFCGNCGHAPQKASSQATQINNRIGLQITDSDAREILQNLGTFPGQDDATLPSTAPTLQL